MDVRNLLFVEPLADGKSPLFKTQLDLAEALIAVPEGGFERKSPENVRIFVNQVLKAPHEPRARPASRNLRRALPQAIRSRVHVPERADDAIEQVMNALNKLKATTVRPAHDDLEVGALWSATTNRDLKEVIVITPNPAETQEDEFSFATQLTDALILKVIIKNDQLWDPNASYDFFILNETNAHAMRANLINHISRTTKFNLEEAENLVAEAQKNERLNIYYFKYDDYLPPMCVFEPNSNKIEGYEMFYINPEKGIVSVAVKDKDDLQLWKKTFHTRMYVDSTYTSKNLVVPIKDTIGILDRKRIAYLKVA